MAEKSLMWTTGAAGDGASAYTMAEVIRWLRQTFLSDNANEGVLKNYQNELEVTGVATPVQVDTGAAYVYGFPYWNTAAVNVVIPTPVVSTRIDRIVLQASWAAQTVRIARVAGVEGAGAAPALTQTDGVTWEISLAQVSVTTGAVITVTDERVFVHPNIEVETAMLADDAVTTAKIAASAVTAAEIANRTRRFLVPAVGGYNNTDLVELAIDPLCKGWVMPNGKSCVASGHFFVPVDYSSGLTVKAVIRPGATGDAYGYNLAYHGAQAEAYNTHTVNSGNLAVGVDQDHNDPIMSISLAALAAGDYVTCIFQRTGTNVLDTVEAACYFVGWLVEYTADS